MSPSNFDKDAKVPEWFDKEVDAMPDPPAEILAQYDYMISDIRAAQERMEKNLAAQQAEPAGFVRDGLFSLAGKLIDWARDRVAELLPPPGLAPELAYARTRGVEGTRSAKKPERQYVDGIEKEQGDIGLKASVWRVQERLEIEITVVRKSDGSEVRPLDIVEKDRNGGNLNTIHIGELDQAPFFPCRGPGIQVFEIKWEGRTGSLVLGFDPA